MSLGLGLTSGETISRATRRDIMDYLTAEKVPWWGRLEEQAFLGRIWDLTAMPSHDSRFRDAAGDIWQHRVNNPMDWEDDWIFGDRRFNLQGCTDQTFVAFLCEALHPLVRPNTDEVERLLAFFNECVGRDDWELVEISQLSGKPVFEGRRREGVKAAPDALDVDGYELLSDPQVVRDHLRRIDRGLKRDPAEAIGSSKELVESVCKVILDDYQVTYAKRDEVLTLYKKVAKALKLNAEAVPDSAPGSRAAQQTLRTLVTTIQSLTELRNELGLGHGRARRSSALTRHGRLAFNSATTVAEFLLDTWHSRRAAESLRS